MGDKPGWVHAGGGWARGADLWVRQSRHAFLSLLSSAPSRLLQLDPPPQMRATVHQLEANLRHAYGEDEEVEVRTRGAGQLCWHVWCGAVRARWTGLNSRPPVLA